MDNSLHEKLKAIENSLPEIEKQLSEIDISKDQKGYAEMAKKHSDVSIIVDLFNEWKKITSEIDDAVELINTEDDENMQKLAPLTEKIRELIRNVQDKLNNKIEYSQVRAFIEISLFTASQKLGSQIFATS